MDLESQGVPTYFFLEGEKIDKCGNKKKVHSKQHLTTIGWSSYVCCKY